MDALYTHLKKFGKVKANEPMKKHTTFKIGGAARFFVIVSETDALALLLQFLDEGGTPYAVIGGGSNMLVHDEGFDGVVIQVKTTQFRVKGTILEADAGCITANMARESVNAGLAGFEWAVGVPGTIGGAVRGNAGAMDAEMKDCMHEVDLYQDGEETTFSREDCVFGYRDSYFKHTSAVILRIRLQLQKGKKDEGVQKMMNCIGYRSKTQPKGFASTGCIFKNYELAHHKGELKNHDLIPAEFLEKGRIPAGWLVEKAGMKGAVRGDIFVSDTHGNFIVNRGSGSSEDVLTLVEETKRRVYDTFGILLEEEIYIL